MLGCVVQYRSVDVDWTVQSQRRRMTILIEIFRAGRHVAASGKAVEFTEADIAAIARNYRPGLHEAPIVLGHPKDNAPAYGWADRLRARGARLQAEVAQVEPSFAEGVRAGRYKKVSASFYDKDSPANPTPGQYYLRHIGFLGAQPPAVKGLAPVQFSEGDVPERGCITIEFAEVSVSTEAEAAAANAADQIVKDASAKVADSVTTVVLGLIVGRVLKDVTAAFPELDQEKAKTTITESVTAALASPPEGQTEGTALQAAIAAALTGAVTETPIQEAITSTTPATADASGGVLNNAEAALTTRERELRRREQELEATQRRIRRTEHETFLSGQAKLGKRLPFQRAAAIDLLEQVSTGNVISFGESGSTTVDQVRKLIEALPVVVDFAERSGGEITSDDPSVIARSAQAYQSEQAKLGNHVSTSEAVRHVKGMR